MEKNYWKISVKEKDKTKDTLDFIKGVASQLKEQTESKVEAVFQKRRENSSARLAESLRKINSLAIGNTTKNNASELYKKIEYEFYITDKSNEYELHIFYLKCNDEFPIIIDLDEEIAEEIHSNKERTFNNASNIEDFLESVIQSNKVQYVIKKLMIMV